MRPVPPKVLATRLFSVHFSLLITVRVTHRVESNATSTNDPRTKTNRLKKSLRYRKTSKVPTSKPLRLPTKISIKGDIKSLSSSLTKDQLSKTPVRLRSVYSSLRKLNKVDVHGRNPIVHVFADQLQPKLLVSSEILKQT